MNCWILIFAKEIAGNQIHMFHLLQF